MKNFILLIFLFATTVAYCQTVPKPMYDNLQKNYQKVVKENQQLKAEINKPSKFSLSYRAGYVPDGGELALNNFSHNLEVGYDLSGVKAVGGLIYDWQITNSSLYMGSEMVLITNQKAKWGIFGRVGTNVGSDKTGFFGYGWLVSYSVGKKTSIISQVESRHYSNQTPVVGINAGVNHHF